MPSKLPSALARPGRGSCRDKSLNSLLREGAIRRGLCEQWQQLWKDDLPEDILIQLFKRGQDFCISNDWPDVDFIRRNFSPETLHKNGVFTEGSHEIDLNQAGATIILLGDAHLHLRLGKWSAVTVFARHNSSLSLSLHLTSRVQVRLYDQASLSPSGSQIRIIDHRPNKE